MANKHKNVSIETTGKIQALQELSSGGKIKS